MSEAAKEDAPKKKGGKLPIILALVLMLGGGGFFMMKKGGGKKEKPAVKLAKEEILLPDEFIVNMVDGRTYVRAKIGLRAKEGFKAEEVTGHDSEISDAIISILKTTRPDDTVTEPQVKKLKMRIAAALNKIFAEPEEHEEESDSKKKKKKKSSDHDEDDSSHKAKSKDSEEEDPPEIPEGWDSAEGPILKVFFKALATQ
jgi:flagellar basal body-associated protein FliL